MNENLTAALFAFGLLAIALTARKPHIESASPQQVDDAPPVAETTATTTDDPSVENDKPAQVDLTPPAPALLTDGPTPLTEAEFADLQKWLKEGKPLAEWVKNHPDPLLQNPAPDSNAVAMITETTNEVQEPAVCVTCSPAVRYSQPYRQNYQRRGFRPLRRLLGR